MHCFSWWSWKCYTYCSALASISIYVGQGYISWCFVPLLPLLVTHSSVCHCIVLTPQLSSVELASFLEGFETLGVTPKSKTEGEVRDGVADIVAIQELQAPTVYTVYIWEASVQRNSTTLRLPSTLSFKQAHRFSCVSGDHTTKDETSFDVWQYQFEGFVCRKPRRVA